MPSLPPDVAGRLALLEAEREIVRTLHRYAHAIDYGDVEAWVDCFTEDGVFAARGRVDHAVSGRDDLRAFVSRHTHAPDAWHKHLVLEPLIEVDGDRATCVSYLAVLQDHDGAPVLRVFGRYRDRLVRDADGRWRFAERLAEAESVLSGLPPLVPPRPEQRV